MSLVRRCDRHSLGALPPKSHRQSNGERNALWLHSTILQIGDTAWTFLTLHLETNNKRFNVLPFRSRITSLLIPSKLGLLTLVFGPPWMIYLINILRPIQQGTKTSPSKMVLQSTLFVLFTIVGYSEASQLASPITLWFAHPLYTFLALCFCQGSV